MRGAASESAATPVSHNAAGPVELNDVCCTKLKLPCQTDSDATLLSNLIHQLGSVIHHSIGSTFTLLISSCVSIETEKIFPSAVIEVQLC